MMLFPVFLILKISPQSGQRCQWNKDSTTLDSRRSGTHSLHDNSGKDNEISNTNDVNLNFF
jgi:hypothetical protein